MFTAIFHYNINPLQESAQRHLLLLGLIMASPRLSICSGLNADQIQILIFPLEPRYRFDFNSFYSHMIL
jgi:hypothetical protein